MPIGCLCIQALGGESTSDNSENLCSLSLRVPSTARVEILGMIIYCAFSLGFKLHGYTVYPYPWSEPCSAETAIQKDLDTRPAKSDASQRFRDYRSRTDQW